MVDWRLRLPILKSFFENVLKSVLDAYNSSDICVFILIDGFDEFNEQDSHDELLVDESKLVHFVQQFYERPTVKLSVAIRAIPVIQDRIGERL